jgi:hypothetical protein
MESKSHFQFLTSFLSSQIKELTSVVLISSGQSMDEAGGMLKNRMAKLKANVIRLKDDEKDEEPLCRPVFGKDFKKLNIIERSKIVKRELVNGLQNFE